MNILDDLAKQNALIMEQNAQIMAKLENLTASKPKEELMTKEEVCAYFRGIHIETLNGWVRSGKLQMYGLVGARFFKRSEVESAPIKINQLKKVA